MKIMDAHCDALLKLQLMKNGQPGSDGGLSYRNSKQIDTSLERLQAGEVKVQFFAIFIFPEVPAEQKWQSALEQVDLFYKEVLAKNPEIKHIKTWEDVDALQEGEIGAVLTLEGADAFGNDLNKLQHLYQLGVLSIGLTWNNGNLCADGVGEPEGRGLTEFGKEVVKLNNKYRVYTDVSHLSIRSFWDVMELADYPFASHSNARSVCDHPRNLNDEQVKGMFEKSGLIHVVFNPPFIVEGSKNSSITDLIKHIDHLCSLGGIKQIGFGSDFDGIVYYMNNMDNASSYQLIINELLKYYSEDEVKGFAFENFLSNRPGNYSIQR